MPNHVQNRLKVVGTTEQIQEVLNHLKSTRDGEEVQIDFNKIKPMPEGLDVQPHSGIEMWAEICTGQIDFAALFQPPTASASDMFKNGDYGALAKRMSASTAMEHLTG